MAPLDYYLFLHLQLHLDGAIFRSNYEVLNEVDRFLDSRTPQFFIEGIEKLSHIVEIAMAGSDVVQSGRPIFDDFFQHLWPYIGNNTANVVFQMVKRLWLIRIDQ
ncbi:hypothetical protein TNCV_2810731 [Trichonephila clavipes]|nr:hypothetical protein TNCV_2810731 [Trichonephila clavipes]